MQSVKIPCRENCGACCIHPAITQAFWQMPEGKPAGVRCVHLNNELKCDLFDDPRRPKACIDFQAETEFCGNNREEALVILERLELITRADNHE